MWAASALIFLMNPLVGGVLLLSAAVTQYVRVRQVDSEYAKRGEMPPTARLVEAWLNRQKSAGKQPAGATVKPYGSRAYAKQRWLAFWEDLGDKHREERAAHKQAVAEAKKNGTPAPVQPPAKERLKGWKWALDKLVRPVGDKPPTSGHAPAVTANTATTPAADGPIITCEDCGALLADTKGGYQHPAGSACTKTHPPASPNQPTPAPQAPQQSLRESVDIYRQRGSYKPVLDPDQKPEPEGEPVATTTADQQSGEVTGIPSAVHYLTQMAAAHRQHADNEGIIASLAGFNVGPADLDLVRAAMTASLNAADLYDDAAKTIDAGNAAVREAYASAPTAADKHAQLAE